jgi:hypothetical protein
MTSPDPGGKSMEDMRPHLEAPAWVRWSEVTAVTALAILLGPIIDPADPLIMSHRFPWPALAPLAVALRYGSLPGLVSGGALVLAATVWSRGTITAVPEWALGWLLVVFAAGLFRDAWARRTWKLEVVAEVRRLRLDGLVRAHRTLEEALEKLQRRLPGQPESLRDSLTAIRRTVQADQEARPRDAAGRILGLFEELGHVHASAIHPVDADGRPGPAIAVKGGCSGAEQDPLVLEAIARRAVASVRDGVTGTGLLAAVPLIDVEDRVRAVVAIQDMPFVALHAETLRLFAVLGGALGDALAAGPSQASTFRQQLRRAALDAGRHGVPAVLARVRVRVAGTGGMAVARSFAVGLMARRRLSDQVTYLGTFGGAPAVAVLLRPAGAEELEGFRRRLSRAAAEEGCAIEVRAWHLAGPGAQRALREAEAGLWTEPVAPPVIVEPREVRHGSIPSPVSAVRS